MAKKKLFKKDGTKNYSIDDSADYNPKVLAAALFNIKSSTSKLELIII